MKFFNYRSAGATHEMLLIRGQVIKNMTQEKVKKASCFALLCDEVCDMANNEQLVTFIDYVDPDSSNNQGSCRVSMKKFRDFSRTKILFSRITKIRFLPYKLTIPK